MSSIAQGFTQYLPTILLTASVALLSLFLLMTVRAKLRRRGQRNDPRAFIRQTRESALGATSAGYSDGSGFQQDSGVIQKGYIV